MPYESASHSADVVQICDDAGVAHDNVKKHHATVLRAMAGPGRDMSRKTLCDVTGMPVRTVDSYMSGRSEPMLSNVKALARALGPTYLNAIFEPDGFTGIHPIDADEHKPPHEVLSMICELAALLSKILEDHHIDHQEAAELCKELPKAISSLANLNAQVSGS